MVDHDALAELGSRVDVDAEGARGLALQEQREIAPPVVPQRVGEAVRRQRVEPFEVEQRVDVAVAGRIAVEHGGEIGAEDAAQVGTLFEHRLERLIDQDGFDLGMIEALSQPVADSVLQPVVAEKRRDR